MNFSSSLIFIIVFLIWTPFHSESATTSITRNRPSCYNFGWPPQMFLLAKLPRPADHKLFTYYGHYCYPNKTQYCRNPENGYKQVNCTVGSSNDNVSIKCNMSGVLNMRRNRICMRISASNKTYTTYSKFKCCSISNYVLPKVRDFQLHVSSKRKINMTWSAPSNIDYVIQAYMRFAFFLTMPDNRYINKTIVVTPSDSDWRSSHFSHILSNLKPYTRYRVSSAAFVMGPASNVPGSDVTFGDPVETRTLPEAPSSPPTVTENHIISQNETDRSVKVKWMHPPKGERNGEIYQTVIEYQKDTSHINDSLPFYRKLIVKGSATEAVINGLVKSADYVMTVRSCTSFSSDDCSDPSIGIMLAGIAPKPTALNATSKGFKVHSLAFILGIASFAALLGVALVFIFLYYLKRHHERVVQRQERGNLPVDVTVESDESDIDEPEQQNEYAYVNANAPFISNEPVSHDEAAMLQVYQNADEESRVRYQGLEDIPLN